MKRLLLSVAFVSLLFSCQKNDSPAPKSFDDTAFLEKIETISHDAVSKSKQRHDGQRDGGKKFWKTLKVIGSDIVGGITGALGGLQLTGDKTAGAIVGGAAGAAAASIKAAESYAVSGEATDVFKNNLKLAPSLALNTHVLPAMVQENPYNYFGTFHNAGLSRLTSNVSLVGNVSAPGGIQYHDSYNQGLLVQSLNTDRNLKPYYDELVTAGYPYTLNQYKNTTRFINPHGYATDAAYYTMLINNIAAFGRPLLSTSKNVLLFLFQTMEQLETIEEVEEYIYLITMEVKGMGDDYPDRDVLLQGMAIAAYSSDFWYTIGTH